jgi:hypothetical protein
MTRIFISLAALALAAALSPAAARPSAQATRPLSATCVAVPEDPFAPVVHATGTCQTAHFGRDRVESTHTVVPLRVDADVLLVAVVDGTETHVAADGDELHAAYSGTARIFLATGRVEFDLDGRYTGGTGRFSGASGTTHISGAVDNGAARFTEEGTITY